MKRWHAFAKFIMLHKFRYVLYFVISAAVLSSLAASGETEWKIAEIGKTSPTGKNTSRFLTLRADGRVVYTRREFFDPLLSRVLGEGRVPNFTERFYVGAHAILKLDYFPGRLQSTFTPGQNVSVVFDALSKDGKLQVSAVWTDPKLEYVMEYTWTKAEDGFYSDYHSRKVELTDKQKAFLQKLPTIHPDTAK